MFRDGLKDATQSKAADPDCEQEIMRIRAANAVADLSSIEL